MSKIISEIKIEHYRGIDGLVLSDLGQVNILVGANNIGKTSVLEAIGMLSNPLDRPNFLKWAIMRIRGKNNISKKVPDYLEFLFSGEKEIRMEAVVNAQREKVSYAADIYYGSTPSGEKYKAAEITAYCELEEKGNGGILLFKSNVRGSYRGSSGLFTTGELIGGDNFYRNCMENISDSMLKEKKQLLLEVVRSFDMDIVDIMLNNDDILLQSASNGVQPLFHYGSGLQKAVLLASVLLNAENNVILIDEIDNSINLAAFQEIFPWFIRKCHEFHVQAFVTTHSMEVIDAIIMASEQEKIDDIKIITMRRSLKTNHIIPQIRTIAQASYDRKNYEMEMRL